MTGLTISRFESKTGEANWLFERREELAEELMDQFRLDATIRSARLEAVLHDALHTKELPMASEELGGRSSISLLRQKLISTGTTPKLP